MKKKILLASILMLLLSGIIFISWNSSDRKDDEIVKKLVNSATFIEFYTTRKKLLKEFQVSNYANLENYRKHSQLDFSKVRQSINLTDKQKKDSIAKMGLLVNEQVDELRKKGNELLLKLKTEIPEFFTLDKEHYKKVHSEAFSYLDKNLKTN
jgi:ABC-type uncharacterized transport system substrate-binding protein